MTGRPCRSEASHDPHGDCPGRPYPPRLGRLLAEAERLRDEANEARRAYELAAQVALEERFADWDRWQVGDVILVRRELCGRARMVPARVERVNLHYSEGYFPEAYVADPGGFTAGQSVSYTVAYRRADGSFSGEPVGVWHKQTAPLPAEVGAES